MEQKTLDEIRQRCEAVLAKKECGAMRTADIARMRMDCKRLLKGLDYLTAHIEALERALQQLLPCQTCIYNNEDCEGCEVWLQGPGEKRWQFDEARFTPGTKEA